MWEMLTILRQISEDQKVHFVWGDAHFSLSTKLYNRNQVKSWKQGEDPPATCFMKATSNACMLCKLSIRIYKFGNSLFNNHPAGYFLRIITSTEFMHNKLLVRWFATELHCLHYLNIDTQFWYRAMNREIKTFMMKRKRNYYSRRQNMGRSNFSRKHPVTQTNRRLCNCQHTLNSYSKSKYYNYKSLIMLPKTN